MTCPYCRNPMQKGRIVCDGRRRPAWWTEDGSRGVDLMKFSVMSLLSTYKIEAHYCAACGKVLIDIAGE